MRRHMKLYAVALLVGLWGGVIWQLHQTASADTFRRGDVFGRGGEGGTIITQTIENFTTETITIQETVDPNIIYDAVGAAVQDWWDLVDTTDNKKKGGKGNPSDKATQTVYYWDVNGVYWTEPNDAPDLVADGEHQYDGDDDALEYTDGTNDFLLARRYLTAQCPIFNPDNVAATDPNWPFLAVEAETFPGGIRLKDLKIKTNASSSYQVQFYDYNAPPGTDKSPDLIEEVSTSTSLEAEDDGTLAVTFIDVGHIVYARLDDANDINMLQLIGVFDVNDND